MIVYFFCHETFFKRTLSINSINDVFNILPSKSELDEIFIEIKKKYRNQKYRKKCKEFLRFVYLVQVVMSGGSNQ